ncbi:hypothetical protein [Frankia tisae]|uniref:hypothetical protein n=1 Tax=Frankia tisae TaxID=2950104 RepID=UPI0021BF8EC3|nr:hypothetical protein [Frankia tisae]
MSGSCTGSALAGQGTTAIGVVEVADLGPADTVLVQAAEAHRAAEHRTTVGKTVLLP